MSERRTLSRSDEVRVRRAREQTKRQKQASERAYRPLPPVTARNVVAKKKRKVDDRRFNIALVLPRSEGLHAPALPRIRPGWRLASLILSLALAAGLYFLWSAPTFRVAEAQVTGASRLSPAEINTALGINGESIFLLRPEEIATRLRLSYPELASAEVMIGLPNQVQVSVTERQPVILWQQGEGYTWIDAAGVAFRPRGDAPGLVQIAAQEAPPAGLASATDPLSPPPYLAPDLVKAALTLASNVPVGASLIYDPRYGFGWNDSRGWQVYFGMTSKEMTLKLRIYQSLVDSLTARGISPAFISVVHADAPYYRMAQ